jgi:hypothetical protein
LVREESASTQSQRFDKSGFRFSVKPFFFIHAYSCTDVVCSAATVDWLVRPVFFEEGFSKSTGRRVAVGSVLTDLAYARASRYDRKG